MTEKQIKDLEEESPIKKGYGNLHKRWKKIIKDHIEFSVSKCVVFFGLIRSVFARLLNRPQSSCFHEIS